MKLKIDVQLDFQLHNPCDLLLQIEVAALPDQTVTRRVVNYSGVEERTRVAAGEGVGERVWLHGLQRLGCHYSSTVELNRPQVRLEGLAQTPLAELPGDVTKYLFASRYCPIHGFEEFMASEFAGLKGGDLIAAMSDWLQHNIGYLAGSSHEFTTAPESLEKRQGVCRDYAHMLIAMARSVGIPARFVSVYSPDVTPMDFHAVAELFLDGGWHLVDATGMAQSDSMAIIGLGRDATDVSFLTSFGTVQLNRMNVGVSAQ